MFFRAVVHVAACPKSQVTTAWVACQNLRAGDLETRHQTDLHVQFLFRSPPLVNDSSDVSRTTCYLAEPLVARLGLQDALEDLL